MKNFKIIGWHFLEEKKLWLKLTSCSCLPDATQSAYYATSWSQCVNECFCFLLCKKQHFSPSPKMLKTPLQLRASGTKEPGRPREFVSPPNTHWARLARKYLWLFLLLLIFRLAHKVSHHSIFTRSYLHPGLLPHLPLCASHPTASSWVSFFNPWSTF